MATLRSMFLGIDLGTSNSVIYGVVDGELKLFKTADGADALPSVIYIDKRGTRLHGRRAQEQALLSPDSVAHGFKRLLGSKTPIELADSDTKLTPEECSADIIQTLLAQARQETGSDDFSQVVITIPAAFNQMQSEATLRAAERAGLAEPPVLLQEPVAAAIAAAHAGSVKGNNGQFLIYDLGGGTFDLALAKADGPDGKNEIRIVANQGINMLGGRDFDRRLVQDVIRPWLAENFDLPEDFMRQPAYRRLLRVAQLAAEKAKIELSSRESASIFASDDEVRTEDMSGADIFLDIKLARDTFEALIDDTVQRTVAVTQQLLADQNLKAADIDRLVFIGGPSKIPLIRAKVADELGLEADLSLDPMTTVARGAALYAAQLAGQPIAGMVSEEPQAAAPAIAINAAKTIAVKVRTRDENGEQNNLLPIIKAGMQLPHSDMLRVTAAADLNAGNNSALSFELFQLEFPERLELNLCIGAFRITAADLPKDAAIKAGDELAFHWAMNASGIMEATVELTIDGQPIMLDTPRFFAPQEGEQSFAGAEAVAFAESVLREAQAELDDINGAIGPANTGAQAGAARDADLLRHRLAEQAEALRDAGGEAELIRQASEEARFIRQDLARLARKQGASVLQRRLGRLSAAYNRTARAEATADEVKEVARLTESLNATINSAGEAGIAAAAWYQAERDLLAIRRLFFAAAWRDPAYLRRWHAEAKAEPQFYPDRAEYETLMKSAEQAMAGKNDERFRAAMKALLAARVSLAASSSASDPATVVKID